MTVTLKTWIHYGLSWPKKSQKTLKEIQLCKLPLVIWHLLGNSHVVGKLSTIGSPEKVSFLSRIVHWEETRRIWYGLRSPAILPGQQVNNCSKRDPRTTADTWILWASPKHCRFNDLGLCRWSCLFQTLLFVVLRMYCWGLSGGYKM